MPLYLLAFGLGMVVGTPLGGRLTDWSVLRTVAIGMVSMMFALLLFTVTSAWLVPGTADHVRSGRDHLPGGRRAADAADAGGR